MMRFQILVFVILWVVAVIECQGPRPGPNGPPPATTASTTDVTDESSTDSSTSIDTSTVKDTVIALIDAGGSCAAVDKNTNCGSAATGYYETFEYNGQRVIIVSGAPNHAAETEMFLSYGEPNPNIRCERWQYSVVPLSPTKSTTTVWTSYLTYPYFGMGAYGYATSGGVFFDTRSSPDGDTAWDNEIDTLDTCMGHSNDAMQYHYHGVPYCIPEDTWLAKDPTKCQFVGYMLDGFPVYGRCQQDGVELESCWTTTATDPSHLSDYTYGNTASGSACLLDEANGYDFSEGQTSDGYVGYGYVTTTEFSGVPIGFMGNSEDWGTICGFTP